MLTPNLSAGEQRQLANSLTAFLSRYRHLSDSYVIEFFTEDLWQALPPSWRPVLQELTYPQIADLLLDQHGDRRYPSAWPLSLLAFRAAAHALAFPRGCGREREGVAASAAPAEFPSSLLGHAFRRHVKPKKQHEIRELGSLVKRLCERTGCSSVVDVGSGQGHLTRFLSFGLGLSVTAVEADPVLVAMASRFDRQLVLALEKEQQKKNCSSSRLAAPKSPPRHVTGWVNPKASWEAFVQQLKHRTQTSLDSDAHPQVSSGEPGGGSCESSPPGSPDFVLTGLHACGDLSATLLRHFVGCPHALAITSVACCYMKITTQEDPTPPGPVGRPFPPAAGQESPPFQFGYPMSSWVRGLPGHQLSYKAREGACHAVEDYVRRLREESVLLRTHCYRAMLETLIRDRRPDLRRAGVQTGKRAHFLPFAEYARLGLARVGLPPGAPLDPAWAESTLRQQVRVVAFFSLSLLLAPVAETLVLLDRMIYLQENGVDSQLVAVFSPDLSPRNLVLVALKALKGPGSEVGAKALKGPGSEAGTKGLKGPGSEAGTKGLKGPGSEVGGQGV
ncbi:methyltransferase-like protein 25B [Brachionichthys hirsutus]|uniref:methyltransferase-like protein 25B n=1 Tax=Brachionichthys hirsutus TaxID=412623 RepID=UPI0036047760